MTSDAPPGTDYWAAYWTTGEIVHRADPQSQVGRTVGRVPVDAERWKSQLAEIELKLDLRPFDTLLDLCAGNGLITLPLAARCAAVTAVDISPALLARLKAAACPNVTVVEADLREIELAPATFTRGLMYGALQYFTEREALGVFETMYRALSPGGTFLVGDIPDIDRRFVFHDRPEWVRAYFESVRAGTPAIGTWFKQDMLVAMARFVGFRSAEPLAQGADLINARYRFDLLLTK